MRLQRSIAFLLLATSVGWMLESTSLGQEPTPVETPAEVPADTPAEVPVETPAETPAEVPADTPAEVPVETPAEVPAETPAAVSGASVPEGASVEEPTVPTVIVTPEPESAPLPRRLPNVGSVDSPMLPGQPWRVHDRFRPRPHTVAPPAVEIAIPAPGDAIVLFDGQNLNEWVHLDREDKDALIEAQWPVLDGYFEAARGSGDLYTIENFADVQLHLEWCIPEQTKGSSQGKGNSGVKFLGLYEVQILDSFQNRTYADGQAGAIYGQYPPAVNVSRPAGQWQSYDIIFEMPKFEGEQLKSPGYLTVLHNGVLVHLRRELAGVTGMRSPGKYLPHPPAGPIMLQDHGDPVRFRNVWARPLTMQP
jgi:hypothetical protein